MKGVFFLAHDRVFDLAVAFLNSFRENNPDIRLCMIPYGEDILLLSQLQERYNFSIYQNREVLASCDEISVAFAGAREGHYRKLACWHGDFDEFIYIDVDTVVLGDVAPVFRFLAEYGFVTSHSNIPNIVRYVWKKSIYKTGYLSPVQINYAANTGFIASRKGMLDVREAKDKLGQGLAVFAHMALGREQPFLNYLIVTSGKKYTSLRALAIKGEYPKNKLEKWAGNNTALLRIAGVILGRKPPQVLLIHWAGKWTPTRYDRIAFVFLRFLRIRGRDDRPDIRFFMPYKKLWQHYRFL